MLIFDGGMGTLLMAEGISPKENSASWAITHPDVIKRIHMDYYRAGSHVVLTDTFAANALTYSKEELADVVSAACTLAAAARDEANEEMPEKQHFWAFDIGPLPEMLEPFGDLEYDEAVEIFAESVRTAEKFAPDLYFIETMNDKDQTLAALEAVKKHSERPVFVSNTYDERGRLFTGASPQEMIEAIEEGGADAVGINCSFGPAGLIPILEVYLEHAHLPVFFKPNAGLPKLKDGQTFYDMTPEEFAAEIRPALDMGLRIVGGCCGTTPEYIEAVARRAADAVST